MFCKSMIAGASVLMLAACGSREAAFVKDCRVMALDEGLDDNGADMACSCAYDRLSSTYSSREVRQAGELLAMDTSEVRDAVASIENGDALLENTESAVKSCAM